MLHNAFKWMSCALILIGALAACSPEPSPLLIPTSTLIPSTSTYTPIPLDPSPTPSTTATAPAIASPTSIAPLLPISISPDSALTIRIIEDLATELAIPSNRISLVTIEETVFAANTMGCLTTSGESLLELSPQEQIAGYRYVLLIGDQLYEYHTNGSESFLRCSITAPVTDDLLIMVDPFAADMFRLVQNRLGEELDISSRRVLLVSMRPVLWRDTSLGCPLEDQTYSTAEIVGYRIVVTAGEQEYIFHSDSNTVYPCVAENEVLP